MIKYEEEYMDFIRANGVGKNDLIASSPKSYVSYLNSISDDISEDISPEILSTEDDIISIAERLIGKRSKKTIGNYKSAMRQYVKMLTVVKLGERESSIIDRRETEKYFEVGDEVLTGGYSKKFRITEFTEKTLNIQPVEAKTAMKLYYEQINAVYSSFDIIEEIKDIGLKVNKALELNNLRGETSTETYLYGMARELRTRRKAEPISLVIWEKFHNKNLEESKKLTKEERLKRLSNASKKPETITVSVSLFRRNADVVTEVLDRAKGECENCNRPAPFLRAKDSTPFLEIHHKVPLSKGGEDTVENAVALCPNCHRKAHYG